MREAALLLLFLLPPSVAACPEADPVLAIVDTGIDWGHSEFNGTELVAWKDFVNGRASPYDDHGHGTAVASRAVGNTLGSAPGNRVLVAKALDEHARTNIEWVASAIRWAADNGAAVIVVTATYEAPELAATLEWNAAVAAAADEGALVVWAAGNSGTAETLRLGEGETVVPNPVPAWVLPGESAATAIAVGSSDAEGQRSTFSQAWPDVLAQGEGVSVAWPGNVTRSDLAGTSLSAPSVAGLAIHVLRAVEGLTAQEVRWALLHAARDTPAACIDEGYGVLDAAAAELGIDQAREGAAPSDGRDLCQAGPHAVRRLEG